eukprot:scpid91399/ scgid31874/ 
MRAVETGLVKKHVRTAHVVELSNRRRVTTPRSRQNRDLVDLIYRDHVSKSEFRGADVGVQCGIVYKLTEGFVGRRALTEYARMGMAPAQRVITYRTAGRT